MKTRCERVGCDSGVNTFSRINSKGKMYCIQCYRRIKKYGFYKRVFSDPNKYIKKDGYYIIYLWDKQGNKSGEAIIDTDDYVRVKNKKWGKDGRGYAHSKSDGEMIKLHQFIIGKKKGFVIDHINGNKLDNRKNNLRFTTLQQNIWNNKKAKGYYFEKKRNKFIVRIMKNGVTYGGKGFDTEAEAREESKKLRLKLFGKYSRDYNDKVKKQF